jgi:hypothetical protein
MLGGNHLRAKCQDQAGTKQKTGTHDFGWLVDEVPTDDRVDARPRRVPTMSQMARVTPSPWLSMSMVNPYG